MTICAAEKPGNVWEVHRALKKILPEIIYIFSDNQIKIKPFYFFGETKFCIL